MGKARRKPRPRPPKWWFLGADGCWFCKNRNNCNQCKYIRKFKRMEKGRKPHSDIAKYMKDGEV